MFEWQAVAVHYGAYPRWVLRRYSDYDGHIAPIMTSNGRVMYRAVDRYGLDSYHDSLRRAAVELINWSNEYAYS